MLEEEAVFPSDDSLDLTSSRQSGCEESQKRLVEAGWPRVLADCSLLFLLFQNVHSSWEFAEQDKDQAAREVENMFGGAKVVWGRKDAFPLKSSDNVPA